MITQLITDKLTSLSLDTSTIAVLSFTVFLVIYFFAKIKPSIDSNSRVRRQVQRREERDRANAIYEKKNPKKPPQQNFQKKPLSSKQKSYYAYLRRNAAHVANKQNKKHNSFKSFSQSKSKSAFSNRSNSGSFGQIKTTSDNAYSKKVINGILSS